MTNYNIQRYIWSSTIHTHARGNLIVMGQEKKEDITGMRLLRQLKLLEIATNGIYEYLSKFKQKQKGCCMYCVEMAM